MNSVVLGSLAYVLCSSLLSFVDEADPSSLIIVNVILGVFVVGCCLLVAFSFYREIRARRHVDQSKPPNLRIFLADGGERKAEDSRLPDKDHHE